MGTPIIDYTYLGTQDQNGKDQIALNACGFWAAAVALFIVMDSPPEILLPDPIWLKTMLNQLIKEYLEGGVSQRTVRAALEAFGLPEDMTIDHEIRELNIVRLSFL